MIVVDASAAISALLSAGPARATLAADRVHVPHLVDSEVANGLRRLASSGTVGADVAERVLDSWRRLGMTRHPVVGLVGRIWELRANISSYDASYLALAETLNCPLLTADGRLARAAATAGIECPVTVVPR